MVLTIWYPCRCVCYTCTCHDYKVSNQVSLAFDLTVPLLFAMLHVPYFFECIHIPTPRYYLQVLSKAEATENMNEIVYITEKVASLLKEKGDFDMAESYLLGAQTKLRVESQMYRALNGTVLAPASPTGATRGRVLSSGSSAALDAAVMGAAMNASQGNISFLSHQGGPRAGVMIRASSRRRPPSGMRVSGMRVSGMRGPYDTSHGGSSRVVSTPNNPIGAVFPSFINQTSTVRGFTREVMPQALHTHEINVQLQLATLYLASNRIPHAVAVIQGLMETKLPRGRRMRIQLMLAEAFLKMRGKKS